MNNHKIFLPIKLGNLILISILLLIMGCMNMSSKRIIVPHHYSGKMVIFFSQEDNCNVATSKDIRRYEMPSNGVYCSSYDSQSKNIFQGRVDFLMKDSSGNSLEKLQLFEQTEVGYSNAYYYSYPSFGVLDSGVKYASFYVGDVYFFDSLFRTNQYFELFNMGEKLKICKCN